MTGGGQPPSVIRITLERNEAMAESGRLTIEMSREGATALIRFLRGWRDAGLPGEHGLGEVYAELDAALTVDSLKDGPAVISRTGPTGGSPAEQEWDRIQEAKRSASAEVIALRDDTAMRASLVPRAWSLWDDIKPVLSTVAVIGLMVVSAIVVLGWLAR